MMVGWPLVPRAAPRILNCILKGGRTWFTVGQCSGDDLAKEMWKGSLHLHLDALEVLIVCWRP